MVADPGERHVGRQRVPGLSGAIRVAAPVAALRARRTQSARLPLRRNGRRHVVVGREEGAQIVGKAEIAHLRAGLDELGEPHDARVLAVEHDGAGRRLGDMAEQPCGVVDLAETVELVAHHVEQQRVPGADLLHEMHGVRLVELEHGDVRVETPAERDLGEQRGHDAAREVRSGRVGEHLQPEIAQHRGDHARGGGLAVRAGDEHHAERQPAERAGEERRVDPLDDLAGERGTAVAQQPRGPAHRLADQRRRE